MGPLLDAYPSLVGMLDLEVRDGVIRDPLDPRAEEPLSTARSRLRAAASEGTMARGTLVRVVADTVATPADELGLSELERDGEVLVEGEPVRLASRPTAYRGRSR